MSRPVALSSVPPVADLYLLYASESYDEFPQRSPVEACPLTAGDEDESRAGVDDASRGGKNGLAAVGDRLIDTPVLARGGGRRKGPIYDDRSGRRKGTL